MELAAENLASDFGSDRVLALPADCADDRQWASVNSKIAEAWKGLDVAVANVGDGRSVPDALPNQERFTATWRTNFVAAEQTARSVLPMLQATRGSLLFVSSIAGLAAIGAPTDYSVAKASVVSLAKQLAHKLAPNVRVNCVAPGNVFSQGGSWDEKIRTDPERVKDIIDRSVPMKRFGTPEEIADAVVFLCSARASFITGTVVRVDGGQTTSLL